jgi:hypothetical protein
MPATSTTRRSSCLLTRQRALIAMARSPTRSARTAVDPGAPGPGAQRARYSRSARAALRRGSSGSAASWPAWESKGRAFRTRVERVQLKSSRTAVREPADRIIPQHPGSRVGTSLPARPRDPSPPCARIQVRAQERPSPLDLAVRPPLRLHPGSRPGTSLPARPRDPSPLRPHPGSRVGRVLHTSCEERDPVLPSGYLVVSLPEGESVNVMGDVVEGSSERMPMGE